MPSLFRARKHSQAVRAGLCVGAAALFGCGPSGPAPSFEGPPGEMERGEAVRSNFTHCGDSSLWAVAQMLVAIAEGLGATAEVTSDCNDFEQELFTGTTLGASSAPSPSWDLLGGGGAVLADAAICALRDLSGGPIVSQASTQTAMGAVSVRQSVGYLDFNPKAKAMDGYHRVEVCAPLIGCLDAQRQSFHAQVVATSPAKPGGLFAGDYPLTSSHGLRLSTEESSQSVEFVLPPLSVPVPPPVLKVDVIPKAGYESGLSVVNTPFLGKKADRARVALLDLNTTPNIHDTYGRSSGTLWTSLLGKYASLTGSKVQSFGIANGWSSQLNLGARHPDPDAAVWDQKVTLVTVTEPSGQKLTLESWPLRPDHDLTKPRSADEKKPTVDFHAGVRVEYDPLDLVPGAFQGLALVSVDQSRIFAEPNLSARYTAQLDLDFVEGFRVDPDGNVRRHGMTMRAGSASMGEIVLKSGIDFEVSVNLFIGKKTIVKMHPRNTLELAGGDTQFAAANASASAETNVSAPAANLASLKTFNSGTVGQEFVDSCLTTPPPPKQPMPEATHTPGKPSDLTQGILFPCNICVAWAEATEINRQGDNFVLPAGAEKVHKSDDFATQGIKWVCGPATNGCFDLCAYDPSNTRGPKFTVKKSKTELGTSCGFVVK